ncbi:MAG TPA: NAD-dependent epimerase/dehydratase family protein, partial [Acidimicrobiia bacterium]|nr:NAD-dependent epimerase/dehydratase family protein [Acidimicrobiia bacterium]
RSDGKAWRPQVHVEDVARAFHAVLEAPEATVHDEAFNVGRTEDNLRVLDIAELVAGSAPGGAEIEFASDAGTDPRTYRVSFAKIESQLPAFRPRWTLEAGIKQLLGVFTDEGLAVEDFPRYQRLHELKRLMSVGVLDSTLTWMSDVA